MSSCPIKRLRDWDTVKDFSQAIVEHLAKTIPPRFVAKSGPSNSEGQDFYRLPAKRLWAATTAPPGRLVPARVWVCLCLLAWEELEALTSGDRCGLLPISRPPGQGKCTTGQTMKHQGRRYYRR